MREIIFRGKRVDNGEWIGGYLVKLGKCSFSDPDRFGIMKRAVPVGESVLYNIKIDEVVPSTVGQCTGLVDKDGKKIYEGDIVHCISKFDIANCVVIFEDGEYRLVPDKYYKNYKTGMGFHSVRCFDKTVIGNIHDNPELLEVS